MECLALTVEEVMHIRQVLVKAELEKFQQYKEIYISLKKGKVDTTSSSFIVRAIVFLSHFKYNKFHVLSVPHAVLPFLGLLFLSDQKVLSLHLVLHLPVLQKVNSVNVTRTR